jgi:hypothetical protein
MRLLSLYKYKKGFSGLINVVNEWELAANIEKKSSLNLLDYFSKKTYIIHGLHNKFLFIALLLRLLGSKIYVMPHGQIAKGHKRSFPRKFYGLIVTLVLQFFDGIIFLGNREFKDFSLRLSNKLKIIYTKNGVRESMIGQPRTQISSNPITIGYIGRIDNSQKGLIDFTSLITKNSNLLKGKFRFYIYGPKSKDKIILKAMLKNSDIIQIMPAVSAVEKIKILDSLDFGFMCSYFEGEPLFSLEAASRGLPVFSTKASNVKYPENISKSFCANNHEELFKLILSSQFMTNHQYFQYSQSTLNQVSSVTWKSITTDLIKSLK